MILRAIKFCLRRARLARHGVAPQCAVPTYSSGARSGVWTVCPDGLAPDGVVYSFGVGDNLAWELDLIARFGVTVHAFDPTPASIAWVAQQRLPARLHFHPIGIAAHDGMATFHLPRRGSRFNYRPGSDGAGRPHESVAAPVRRLGTIAAQLGHSRLAVLKLDVEGAEYDALADLPAEDVAIDQLLIEFHHHFPGIGLGATVSAVRSLNAAGYRIFHISPRGLEVSFLRAA
jgi:FkbM family methyltransferase